MLGAIGLEGGIGRFEVVGNFRLEEEAHVREETILDAEVADGGKLARIVLAAELIESPGYPIISLAARAEPGGEPALVPEGPVQPKRDGRVLRPRAELDAAGGLGCREGRPVKGQFDAGGQCQPGQKRNADVESEGQWNRVLGSKCIRQFLIRKFMNAAESGRLRAV